MIKVKGITHVHSLYSDSLASLPKIKAEARKHGFNFVLMADHLFRMDDFKRFKKECAELSDDAFLMVPGIEVGSEEGYHFLAYNVSRPPFWGDKHPKAAEICSALSDKDSFFALAHASLYRRPPSVEILRQLDGLEVWNTKYDTKFAPNIKAWLLAKKHGLIPLPAVDAHGRFCLKRLWLEMRVQSLSASEIIASLKKGDFTMATRSLRLDLRKELTAEQKKFFKRRNRLYSSIRYPVCAFVRSGFNFPEPVLKLYQKMFQWL